MLFYNSRYKLLALRKSNKMISERQGNEEHFRPPSNAHRQQNIRTKYD